jgi:outer membrane lipoprotein-sorting protein
MLTSAGVALAQVMPPIPLPRPGGAIPPAAAPPGAAAPAVPAAAAAPLTPEQQQQRHFQILREISTVFNGIRSLSGDFVQIGPFGDQTEGTFMMQKPGRVRFHYDPPVQVDVISDGNTVLVDDRGARSQNLYPLAATPLKHLLANQIDLTDGRLVQTIQEEADLIALGLRDNTVTEGHITLIFDIRTYELKQWVVTDAQGYDTSVAIYNVEIGAAIDPAYFSVSRVVPIPQPLRR